jgi:hypothetical protein
MPGAGVATTAVIAGAADGSADVDAFADITAFADVADDPMGEGVTTVPAEAVAPAVGAAEVTASTIGGATTAISAELVEASFAVPSNKVVTGLSFFEFGSAVRANETPTPPTSTATAVAATVKVFLLKFCNRLMMFSFEQLQPHHPEKELPQQNARTV